MKNKSPWGRHMSVRRPRGSVGAFFRMRGGSAPRRVSRRSGGHARAESIRSMSGRIRPCGCSCGCPDDAAGTAPVGGSAPRIIPPSAPPPRGWHPCGSGDPPTCRRCGPCRRFPAGHPGGNRKRASQGTPFPCFGGFVARHASELEGRTGASPGSSPELGRRAHPAWGWRIPADFPERPSIRPKHASDPLKLFASTQIGA